MSEKQPDQHCGRDQSSKSTMMTSVLESTLAYSRERDYTGYDYFDGMSSKLLQALPFENKWLNIGVQESIKRAPVNIRPLFAVEQRQNFKGSALFLMANNHAYYLTGEETYREEALRLAEWLVENQSDGYEGFCGGHRHAMQMIHERRPPETPNIIPTSYAVKALLKAAEFDPTYENEARSATKFVEEELEYREVPKGAKIKYQPHESGDYYTLNGGAIGARMYVDLYDYFGDEVYRDRAQKLLDYLVTKQTDLGGWMYRDPPSASHLSMDNHHNGFIIESYYRYKEVTGSKRYDDLLSKALEFYRSTLFEPNGAPNWDENNRYPKDIHAATQGIILFSMTGEHEFAQRILDWVLNNLYAGQGRFYYQRRRFYTKKFTLMRWCQAWMSYAISEHLRRADSEHIFLKKPKE